MGTWETHQSGRSPNLKSAGGGAIFWRALGLIVILSTGASWAWADGTTAVELKSLSHPSCPGQKFAALVFDPRIEWVKDSAYRLHLKVAMTECDPTARRWRQRSVTFADEKGVLTFAHPWTNLSPQVSTTIPMGLAIGAGNISKEELSQWLTDLGGTQPLSELAAGEAGDRTQLLGQLQERLGQTQPSLLDSLWLHLVTFDFDLNTILTPHDRQLLSTDKGRLKKTAQLDLQLTQNSLVRYQLALHLDQWAQVRVHALRQTPPQN